MLFCGKRWHGILLFLMLILLGSVGQAVYGHDLNPSPRPLLPACYEADLRCSLPVTSEGTAGLLPAPVSTPTASTPTTNKIHDGKWLQLMPDLLPPAQARAMRAEPRYNIPCVDGFADIYPCNQVDLLAHLPYEMIGGKANNDSWGWRDPLDGREYALIGARDGVIILDITTPDAPFYLGKLPTHSTSSSWRDLKVYQDHLFVVADYNPAHGMQIFDLRTLRGLQRASAPLVLHESAHYAGFEDAHNLAINEESGFAYIVGSNTCDGGLHMVDIRTPMAPVAVGCYAGDGYIHDTTCVNYVGPDARYQGRELCFNASVTEFTIVDVTDKAKPTRIATYSGPGNAYIHQGWLTADQRY
ncbi:MAG: choice-of-anchor B family protein, partial [Caldilineaceae bacterium]|nr:choice-of-anchor B family protein [Caldilineaceae bacterium]